MKFSAKDQYTWEEDRFTQDHIVTMCGTEIKIPVLELEFEEMAAMPKELAEVLQTSHRDRMRKPADELLQKKLGKIATRSSAESLSRMRLAVCGFADELHAGLNEELKKKTRMEIFRALRFVARTPAKGTKKIVQKISKKTHCEEACPNKKEGWMCPLKNCAVPPLVLFLLWGGYSVLAPSWGVPHVAS